MKPSAVVLAVVAILAVPLVVHAHLSLQANPEAVGRIRVEIHSRGADEIISCDGMLRFDQNRVPDVVFERATNSPARCRDVVELPGALDGVTPGEHVLVHADIVR